MTISSAKSFHEIIQVFQECQDITVLSLDCFDTLFWRYFASPLDVFTKIAPNVHNHERIVAETQARFRKTIQGYGPEVNLEEIYQEVFLSTDNKPDLPSVIQYEIDTEMANGMLFHPAIEILRLAKQRGIRTIVVSDTYFKESQLREILAVHEPEINKLIDKVYCSCEYGYGKSNGLWPKVIKIEKVKPFSIFHVGDNIEADYKTPVRVGVNANWFEQQSVDVKKYLEMRKTPASIMFPDEGIRSLFHSWYSINARKMNEMQKIAYLAIGPIMACFAGFIHKEVERYNVNKTKVAFLMRDGYLPKLAYESLTGNDCSSLRISRLTTISSSFFNTKNISDHLVHSHKNTTEEVLFKQLLLPDAIKRMIGKRLTSLSGEKRKVELNKILLSEKVSRVIVKNSEQFRERLFKHIERETAISPGETLLLVDLGYTGTTVRLLRNAIEKKFQCQVKACYLVATGAKHQEGHVKGLINPNNIGGHNGIHTLVRFISALEMLSCSTDGSVVGYADDGTAILDSASRKLNLDSQKEIGQIHAEVINFTSSNKKFMFELIKHENSLSMLGMEAAIDLARFLYFPDTHEISLLESLSFDVNMGFELDLSITNLEKALCSMREQGVFTPLLDNTESQRAGYAAEVRYAGLELSIALMSIYKNDISFSSSAINNTLRTIDINVLFALNGKSLIRSMKAYSTFDGYYVMPVPLNGGEVAVMFGQKSALVEVANVQQCAIADLYKFGATAPTDLIVDQDYFYSEAETVAGNVIRFEEGGFIYVSGKNSGKDAAITIAFRDLCSRKIKSA